MKLALHKARTLGKRQPNPQVDGQTVNMAAPVTGLVETAATGEGCSVCENVLPTRRGLRVRGGKYAVADIGEPVTSLFSYQSGAGNKLFAATDTDIYDISALDPEAVLVADVASQTTGLYSTAQIGTAGGEYLYAVNGSDEAQLFDGTTWLPIDGASTPAITAVGTDDLSYVWTHKNRFWFVEGGTQYAWYLPVNSIGGTAVAHPLAGVFKLGGPLLFGFTWSADSGAGMDDRQVFVSTLGEVAVYEGTDPASAETWGLVGLYRIDPPLGPNAHVRNGGDVLICTAGGLVAMSAVFQQDPASLRLTSASRNVSRTWASWAGVSTLTSPWEAIVWPDGELLMVSLPDSGDLSLVANLETGAWSIYRGWDVQSLARFGKGLFFGSQDGFVYQAERGGSDAGSPYVARLSYLPNDMGMPGAFKTGSAIRATFYAGVPFTPKLSLAAQYSRSFPAAPPADDTGDDLNDALWDIGRYDQAFWDTASTDFFNVTARVTKWVSVGGVGVTLSPQVQVTSNGDRRPNVEFLSCDVLYSVGAVAVA